MTLVDERPGMCCVTQGCDNPVVGDGALCVVCLVRLFPSEVSQADEAEYMLLLRDRGIFPRAAL